MKNLSFRISLIFVSILLLGSTLPQPQVVSSFGESVQLTKSDSTGIHFEVQVPWSLLSLETISHAGQTFTKVSLPQTANTAELGAPQLPLMSYLLAVPFGVEFDLKIQPGKSRSISLDSPVLPMPTEKVDWSLKEDHGALSGEQQIRLLYEPNPDIYAKDVNYPGILGEIANEGTIRQQRVVSIAVYPVQYLPSRSGLILYETFSISLSFRGQIKTVEGSDEIESLAYEELFKQKLLNYSSSLAWRLPVSQQGAANLEQVESSVLNTLPWTPPDPAWRIQVREEGIHRITYANLSEAGLDVDNLDPRTFQMFYKGQEIAIWVEGEADAEFNTTDGILFFAVPLENKYSLDNVYWLTYGSVDGARMQTRSSQVPTNPAETHFVDIMSFEENNFYVTNSSGDDDFERFLWDYFYAIGQNPGTWNHSFSLNQSVNGHEGDCVLDLDLLGFSVLPQNHHAKIFMNDHLIGELFWQGRSWSHSSITFSNEILLPVNTLRITLPNDQGASLDWIYVDRFSVTYPSNFKAQNNTLEFDFDLEGGNRFDLEGFSTDSVYLFDTSDPENPQFITDFQMQPAGAEEYSLSFQEGVALGGSHAYAAVGTEALHQVHAIEQDTSSFEDPINGADYVIITHEDFLVPAQTLADHRQSQGLRTAVVKIQDIYDQFGYGIVGKDPIHAFLSYAYQNWEAPAPSYVVLMGDGHYNPKGYNPSDYGAWRESFIPPYLAYADPYLGETVTDNRYVVITGDDPLPDMMLGRMAVMTEEQAAAFVNKIISYEQNPSSIDWQSPVLAVADNSDSGGNFPAISQFLLSSSLPEEYQAQRVYLGVTHSTIADAKAAILAAINDGKFLVNYIGHGATYQWADGAGGLLAADDVVGLTNLNKYPIISAMTCKEGYYINPDLTAGDAESLAEVITRAENKGAIASWSPTGMGVAIGHDIINRELFVAIFSDLVPRMGQATQQSLLDLWASGTYLDLIDTYLLFGDPATMIKRELRAFLPFILR